MDDGCLFCFSCWQSLPFEMQRGMLLRSAFGGAEYEKLVGEAADYLGRAGPKRGVPEGGGV